MKNKLFNLGLFLGMSALMLTSACKKEVFTGISAPSTVAIGEAIKFTDTQEERTNVSFAWDFGDGNSSTDRNPSHVYQKAGSYTVTQTVYLNQNATKGKFVQKTESLAITVEGPAADFTTDSVLYKTNQPIVITNSTVEKEKGFITTYEWSYSSDNGTSGVFSTKKVPAIKFAEAGKYTITLTATQGQTQSVKSTEITVANLETYLRNQMLQGSWTPITDFQEISNSSAPVTCTALANGTTNTLVQLQKLTMYPNGVAHEITASNYNQTLGTTTTWNLTADGKYIIFGTPSTTSPAGYNSGVNNFMFAVKSITNNSLVLEQILIVNSGGMPAPCNNVTFTNTRTITFSK
jgi:PKD repeat protein